MPTARSRLGTQGEAVAAAHLQAKGLRIIDRNVRSRYGEVDILARDGDEWVFVEVKTRRTKAYGAAEEAITPRKAQRLARTAQIYLQREGLDDVSWRIDVVTVTLNKDGPADIAHLQSIEAPEG